MGKLRILASGHTSSAQAQARGKLFERLMADVLRHQGYTIDHPISVNYSGMEIDIEGRSRAAGTPLYAECKCYESDVEAPKLQTFFGKYMTRWLKDNRAVGLFIALPGLNSHAMGFYRENCEGRTDITVRLLEETAVLDSIYATHSVIPDGVLLSNMPRVPGTPGDRLLLYTESGFHWVQYIISNNDIAPRSIVIFDAQGTVLSNQAEIEAIVSMYPPLADFQRLVLSPNALPSPIVPSSHIDEIVEVQRSSAPFEYQFPAAPQYFIGRSDLIAEISSFVDSVLGRQTSARGLLFEGNSG